MNDTEFCEVISKARAIASEAGSMSGLWDAIGDAEALLRGQRSILPRTEVEVILSHAIEQDSARALKAMG